MFKLSRYINLAVALVMVVTLFAAHQPAAAITHANMTRADTATPGQFVPGEVLVGFSSNDVKTVTAQATAMAGTVNAQVVNQYGSMALLSFSPDADVKALATQLGGQAGVEYAQPNYVLSIPAEPANPAGAKLQTGTITRMAPKGLDTQGKPEVAISIKALQGMRTKVGNKVQTTYPNDPYLFDNNGWDWVGAGIVWPNKTASANICELDTGVDYTHPDLASNIINGSDFVNGDADPMDDFGHGTHVAGIIAAKMNNGQGMAGVSTGKVVAVKVLDSQGYGTDFDVAAGINYCANRTDIKVLSMSLGGGSDDALKAAVAYAVNAKGKLLVAAAGNDTSNTPIYPAGYATDFPNKVLAVAASGYLWEDSDGYWYLNNNCQSTYTNYGSWVSVVGPGTDIYSTTPWDKPFYMNSYYGTAARYDYMSGTSMATPFVAAAAARRWGYKPLETNDAVGTDVINSGWPVDGSCWDSSMSGVHQVNVASLLDRGALEADAYDASTGVPLSGASLLAYQGATLEGSAVISPSVYTYTSNQVGFPPSVYTNFNSYSDVLNLPVGSGYQAKINKSGYTNGTQPAYQHSGTDYIGSGQWDWFGRTGVPPKSASIETVLGWWWNGGFGYGGDEPSSSDLDLDIWLPKLPNPVDIGQPSQFIVGNEGNAFGYVENDPRGAMTAFPFARLKRDGSSMDVRIENTTIAARAAHAPLAANTALPYYAGTYTIMVSDAGQTIDYDGLGDTIPLMGVFFVPHVYIWKDGNIKLFVTMNGSASVAPLDPCNTHWWEAATISSGVSGTPTFTAVNDCAPLIPYAASSSSGVSTK